MIGQKNRRFKKFLSLVLTLLMLVTAVPITVSAQTEEAPEVETKQAIDYVEAPKAIDKITDEVKEDMLSGDAVEIIVYMKDKLDSIAFAEQALAKHSRNMSKYKANLQVRRDLVLALKDQSHKSQYGLRKLVDKYEDQVAEFQSFYIANVAYMKVDPDLVEEIAALPDVEKITKNKTYYLDDYIVEDIVEPQEGEYLWNLEMVRAPETWGTGVTGRGAVVGMLDSGADYTHPAIHNKWRGLSSDGSEDATYSWYDTVANEPLPVDSDQHGTHVCGTMVGSDEASDINTGVAPGAKWICARVFNPQGSTTDFQLLDAAEWMVAPGGNPDMAPDAVNNSWGGGSGIDDWYIETVDNYVAAGIVPVFSAGNQRMFEPIPQPGSISIPANYEKSLAVAAIDSNKLRPEWSKRGPSPYTDNWKPEISAPGVSITSSLPGNKYGLMSGTSMAAPHITASVALLRSANNTLTVEQIRNVLFENTEPLTDSDPNAQESPNHDYGWGLVDTFDSVAPVAGDYGKFVGKVLREGTDIGPPVFTHEQEYEEVYLGVTIDVEVEIIDDVSVTDAYMMIKAEDAAWEELPLKQIDGGPEGGTYVGTIPASSMGTGENFQYKFVAKDYVDNIAESEVYTVAINFGVTPGAYEESFEGNAEGWIMDPLWQIGSPSAEGEPEVPHGDQYIATVIGGNYGANEDAFLISPPIDMRATGDAEARFLHWHSFTGFTGDDGTIYVTNDFGQTLNKVKFYQRISGKWLGEIIDLSDYAFSETPVHIIYHFKSNGWTHDLGWYIDNFSIESGSDTTPPPAPTNVEALAGLNNIKITWDFNLVPDFDVFEIYRSTAAGSLGTLIATTESQVYQDPYSGLEDDTDYYYTVRAVDFSGNKSEDSNQSSARKAQPTVIQSWDFEANDGGFTHGTVEGTADDWEWGAVDAEHGPGAALTGTNVWATGLSANYSTKADAYLQTPEIAVPAEGATFMTMNHWYHFEQFSPTGTKWDYGQVLVKATDEDEWVNLTPGDDQKFGGPPRGQSIFWSYDEVDLSQFAGKTVEIRFFYHTDFSGVEEGWFINNVDILNVTSPTSGLATGSVKFVHAKHEPEVADFSLDFATVGEKTEYEELDFGLMNIPVHGGTVEVLESGMTVKSDDRTGDYEMMHKVSEEGETWTLKAEAYGYVPELFETTLADEETVEHIFILQEKDKGTITGQVYDRYSHDPAPHAIVTVVEDPNVAPVVADENGNFTISDVYVGDYTLHASAEDFENGTAEVTVEADETVTCDIPLKRFVGVPGEIIYDDGEAENAIVLNREGGGVAMRFTPEKFGKLLDATFYFWKDEWPQPGGNEVGFGVFVKDGSKYKQIGETKFVDDIVRGDWYTIDLSDLQFSTDQDFYVTTIQNKDGDHSPGVGLDENPETVAEAGDRSYLYVDGSFIDFASEGFEDSAAMIRCTMLYAAETPVITNLDDVSYTNEDSTPVEGIVDYDQGNVLVYAGDEVAKTIGPEDLDGNTFATTIDLLEEETYIKASLQVGDKETEPSEEKLVIKDQIDPELIVATPKDGDHVNAELIHVKGKATDKYFDKLTINGDEVLVDEKGIYDYKLIVEEGENPIEVKAVDKAGNEAVENLIVYAGFDDVYITDMQPAEDVTVGIGDTVEVSFYAPAGGLGEYTVIPSTRTYSTELDSIPMTEVEPGYYKAIWTAPDETENAKVYFEFTDAYGTYTDATAPGRITVVKGNLLDRLYGSNRYKTATKLSQLMYEEAETVILASGENFPDALVGGSYAEELDVPILLTRQADLPEETLAELGRLGTTKVIILGGPLAISSEVESTLEEAGLEVERIAGSNRYKTAVEIARLARAEDSTHVFIASGEKFEDALSIVPAVALSDDALLLTSKAGLHEATLAALEEFGTESITLMGGELVIPKVIEEELKDLGYAVDRIAGSNRYKTNIQIAEQYFPAATKVIGASGVNFPDALVATVYAAKEGRPIILLDPDGLRDVTVEYFEDKPIEHVLLMGGPLAIPRAVEYHILGILQDK